MAAVSLSSVSVAVAVLTDGSVGGTATEFGLLLMQVLVNDVWSELEGLLVVGIVAVVNVELSCTETQYYEFNSSSQS